MGGFGVAQIVIFIGFLEIFIMKQKEGSFPGDMSRINPFEKQWESFDEETKLRKRAIELNNGRAAQMGIFGMIVHEVLSNQPYIINDILGELLPSCLFSKHPPPYHAFVLRLSAQPGHVVCYSEVLVPRPY